jgi:hypothetical protein
MNFIGSKIVSNENEEEKKRIDINISVIYILK